MSPPVSPLDTTDCEAEPLALSPRSSGTNIRTSLNARSHEVPGLRTFLSHTVTSLSPTYRTHPTAHLIPPFPAGRIFRPG